MRLLTLFLCLWVFPLIGKADDSPTILPANEVFVPRVVQTTAEQITVAIDIKPGYYLYRERLFSLAADEPAIHAVQTTLSDGSTKTDQFFGTQSVWYGGKDTATVTLRYDNRDNRQHTELTLKYQGCQDGVICYPPQRITLPVTLPPTLSQTSSSSSKPFFSTPEKTTLNQVLSGQTEPSILPEDQAFPFFVEQTDATTLTIRWQIADGYYLYRDKIKITADNHVARVQLSEGEAHTDEFFGEQSIYRGQAATAVVYLKKPQPQIRLNLSFQGCAEVGICYPIMTRQIDVENANISTQVINSTSERLIDRLTAALASNLWVGVGLLLVAGVLLSFTPCVLPMLPILLGIITNQRQVGQRRAAVLSTSYAVGVAAMMAVFGLVVAKTGVNIQVIFQKPLWLLLFAAIFIAMGFAMLGLFNVAMPSRVQAKIIAWQNRFQKANPLNLFVVGALSTLVVGPCIAPPLVAVLAFISTTGDSLLGALYLFALGLGMSLPLVVFATLVTAVPKTGAFSQLVTRVFAVLMFGVGLWLLARLLPGAVSLVLWGLLMFGLAWVLWQTRFVKDTANHVVRVLSVVAVLLGTTWVAGGISGHNNPLRPFTKTVKLPFTYIHSMAELNVRLANTDKVAMLDLYADWCVSCQELEHITFTDSDVATTLQTLDLLKVDMTDTTAEQRQLLKELNLIGPPALLFFKNGQELTKQRQIGTISAENLLSKLKQITQ